jgi:type IV pilus assembly protein PilB
LVARAQLGNLLLERGLVSPDQLEDARAEQGRTGRPLGRVLLERQALSEGDLSQVVAEAAGLEFVDLDEYPLDPTATALITDAMARRYTALPVSWDAETLVVAMSDPSNVVAIDDIRSITRADVRVVVSTPACITSAIDRSHRVDADVEETASLALDHTEEDEDLAQLREVTEDAPIVRLVNLLIRQAVQDRASDIHVEPAERDVRVRYRVDGVLHEVMRTPKRVQNGLISRLKIMADLDIAERRVPQDGRVSVQLAGRQVDLRVATLPTVFGEKVVLRVLDKGTATLDLAELGFLPGTMARFETAFSKPYGTILVTGPTGSGKSTTLYATLNRLNDPSKNIITVEDPVEYRLPDINQVQVHSKAGLTFAAALRSILRSDPDIVLLGEIRDRETAAIAMEAAITGHLVLSTLHTNSAVQTPTRLIEMGLEPYLVSSAVDCVVAQRLARRLCDRCKEPYAPTSAELTGVDWDGGAGGCPDQLYRPVGCGACGRKGYLGRFALHEVLLVSEELETMIAERASSEELRRVAVSQGMQTLRQAGLAQVAAGITSVEEILRVVA